MLYNCAIMETMEGIQAFDPQFQNQRSIELREGKIDVVDIIPPHQKDTVPVFIAPGWSEDNDSYMEALRVIYDSDRRGLTVKYSRRGGDVEEEGAFPKVELRKAKQILGALDDKGIDCVDGIFHSEGVLNGLIAAMIAPTKFRNIVLDGVPGLDEKSRMRHAVRTAKLLIHEAGERRPFPHTDPRNPHSSLARSVKYVIPNVVRALAEQNAIVTQDITDMIFYLAGEGVMISLISRPDDPLFPTKNQIEKMRGKTKNIGEVLPLEGFYSAVGGHDEISIHPHEHMALALDALTNLQRRRERLEKENSQNNGSQLV